MTKNMADISEIGFLCSEALLNSVIIKHILTFLPARNLNTCARVCRLWEQEVKNVKRSRRGMAWHYYLCEETDTPVQQEPIISELKSFFENLYFEPGFAFVFLSTNLFEDFYSNEADSRIRDGRLRPAKKDKVTMNVFLEQQLPSKCKVTTITADGIVGTSKDKKVTEEMESRKCISLIVFSEFTIDIVPLYYDQEEGHKLANVWSNRADAPSMTQIPEERNLKSIVFLCDEAFCPQEVGFSLYKMYRCPMIAGGFVDNVVCPQHWSKERDNPFLCCLGLCGVDVQVASVVIKDDVKTIEEVDKIMKKLKNNGLPEKKSVGFMFACVGRGENHYGEQNVESKVFRKHFPNTPLLGFFGNGEVGFEYPHLTPEDMRNVNSHDEYGAKNHPFVQQQPSYLSSHPPKMYHAYTTIMSIVSFA